MSQAKLNGRPKTSGYTRSHNGTDTQTARNGRAASSNDQILFRFMKGSATYGKVAKQ